MDYCEPARSQRAFTLPELMITLAIISILTALSLPALYPAEESEARQVFMQMGALIASARATAVSRHSAVMICPGQVGGSCDNNWTYGVLMFMDSNENRQFDPQESLIDFRVWGEKLSSDNSGLAGKLMWKVFGNRQHILVTRLGEIADQNGSLTWCPPENSSVNAHQMVLNSAGRVRLAQDHNGDGFREDSQGQPLLC